MWRVAFDAKPGTSAWSTRIRMINDTAAMKAGAQMLASGLEKPGHEPILLVGTLVNTPKAFETLLTKVPVVLTHSQIASKMAFILAIGQEFVTAADWVRTSKLR